MIYARWLCAVLLVFVASASGAATRQDGAPIDVAARWNELLDHGDGEKINATLLLPPKVAMTEGGIDAEACRRNAQAFEDALKVNTVGLGLWYAAYRCSVALGNQAEADSRLRVFSALVRYGVESSSDDFGLTPIRILSPQDVEAFILASGQELLYVYYDPPTLGRHLTMHVSLWDAESKRERLLYFDYLDTRVRLLREQEGIEFPVFRTGIARGFIKTFGQDPNSWAGPAYELEQIVNGGGAPAERMAKFEKLAGQGAFASAMTYAIVCQLIRAASCADKSVETILPWAEKSFAMALITLSLAYEEGAGVKQNSEYAQKLLQAADRRMGRGKASVFAASLMLLKNKRTSLPPSLAKSLETAANDHEPMAEMLFVALEALRTHSQKLNAQLASMLGHAASSGLAPAQSAFAGYLIQEGKLADGIRWLQAAAGNGDAGAQRELAGRYERGDGMEKNLELAKRWYGEAGRGGDRASMLWMAKYYALQPVSAKTRYGRSGWLESAMVAGSTDAALELAALYREGGEGVPGNERNAAEIYRSLNSPEARRHLASILMSSKTVEHDLVEAKRLLQVDADRGDMRSRVSLADSMARGDFGKEQMAEGARALQKAADEGDPAAMVEFGILLFYGQPPQRKAGIDWWQKAADKGDRTALNNLAWALCTADEPGLVDGKRGLDAAKKLVSDTTPLSFVDTVAACYAAAGDFAQAISVATGALKKAEAQAPRSDRFIDLMRSRIALFGRHQPYVEVVESKTH